MPGAATISRLQNSKLKLQGNFKLKTSENRQSSSRLLSNHSDMSKKTFEVWSFVVDVSLEFEVLDLKVIYPGHLRDNV